MAVNVKMGVDLGGFKSGIQQGTQILKGLNAEMKATEAEFKATGNAEQKMASQTKNLTSQIQVQKGIVDQAQKALDAMTKAGIDPADKAYQQMYATMMKAQQGMYEAQAALNSLGESAQQAAGGANELVTSVNSIGKKISLDQVISGIGSITGALETAAGKAVQLGETIWNAVMDRAKWADDTQTMALMYGIDVDTLQRMQKLVTNGLDTTVDAILTAQSRLKRGVGSGSIADDLRELHLTASELKDTGGGILEFVRKDSVDLFWEAGQAIMNLGDEYEKEEKAQKLFGRGWKELVPLFSEYKSVEEYRAALEKVNVSSDEDINNMATLNDKISELKGNLEQLSTDILAQLAPGLSTLADALNGVLTEIIKYLKTEDGQKMLQSLSDSVSSLFEDLGKIDPASVVESFTSVFNGLIDGLKWIVDNKETLIDALTAVVAGWAGLKITGGLLKLVKLVDGLKGLGLLGGGGGASGASAGGGAAATGAGGAAGGTAAGVTAAEVAQTGLFAAPFALFIDGVKHDMELVSEWTKNAQESMAEYQKNVEQYSGSEMFDIWDIMTRYTTVNGSPEDQAKMKDFAQHFFSWWNDEITDAGLDELAGAMNDEDFFAFKDAMEKIMNGEMLYSSEDQQAFVDAMDKAIAAAEGLMKPVNVKLQADENSASELAAQVGIVKIPVRPEFITTMYKHANGLPWVPYDGYLAYLHRGERVMTASQNRNYTYNNNNYFGNVNLNNGQDIDALCDRIDQRNRRQMSGFGA